MGVQNKMFLHFLLLLLIQLRNTRVTLFLLFPRLQDHLLYLCQEVLLLFYHETMVILFCQHFALNKILTLFAVILQNQIPSICEDLMRIRDFLQLVTMIVLLLISAMILILVILKILVAALLLILLLLPHFIRCLLNDNLLPHLSIYL
jgi:hypothetical protein